MEQITCNEFRNIFQEYLEANDIHATILNVESKHTEEEWCFKVSMVSTWGNNGEISKTYGFSKSMNKDAIAKIFALATKHNIEKDAYQKTTGIRVADKSRLQELGLWKK